MSCDRGYFPRKLSIREATDVRAITICVQPSAIPPLLCLVALVLLEAENCRWALRYTIEQWKEDGTACRLGNSLPLFTVKNNNNQDSQSKEKRRASSPLTTVWVKWRGLFLSLASAYPIFYNHDMMFMYINDKWFNLFAVQVFFTATDDLCLWLRWFEIAPYWRVVIRLTHVIFNVFLENNLFVPRNVLFLLDDLLDLMDVGVMGAGRMVGDGNGRWWISLARKYAVTTLLSLCTVKLLMYLLGSNQKLT